MSVVRTLTAAALMLSLAMLSVATVVATPPAHAAAELKAGVFDPPRDAPDFKLSASDGSELTLSRYRGKVVILYFGFTSCPAVCPTTLATLAKAHTALGEEAAGMQVVYVTVDPERDTAVRMREYLAGFNPTFIGGTGSAPALEAVRKEYGILASKDASGLYSHSSSTVLIDRAGKLRALMPYGSPPESYVHDVRILLAE